MSEVELEVLREADFDWNTGLAEVWTDPAWDVPDLHKATRAGFAAKLDAMSARARVPSRLGHHRQRRDGVKTHLLGAFRHEAARRKAAFILVDMTDVRDFWERYSRATSSRSRSPTWATASSIR